MEASTSITTLPVCTSAQRPLPTVKHDGVPWLQLASVLIATDFCGKERDTETGLDNLIARYYSGAQGRFTSPDEPLLAQREEDPQSWNLYAYGLNNPLKFVDPDGHEPCVNGVNPENGNICTVGTAPMPSDPKPQPVDPGQVVVGGLKDTLNLLPTMANLILLDDREHAKLYRATGSDAASYDREPESAARPDHQCGPLAPGCTWNPAGWRKPSERACGGMG
jgi:RHS repeat-associated protein